MNLPHRFENAEAVREIYFIGMLFDQILHDEMMGSAADNTNIVVPGKLDDFLVIDNILGRLPGIAKTGQTVGGDTGDIIFHDSNDSRHG
jgi:hypothetical protein